MTVTATNGRTAVDTFVVTVTEVNDTPDAFNDTLTAVDEDSGQFAVPFATLLGNDTKGPANENAQTLTVTLAGGTGNPTGGTVVLDTPNSQVLFTPAANFNGQASFDYTITDNGTTNTFLIRRVTRRRRALRSTRSTTRRHSRLPAIPRR